MNKQASPTSGDGTVGKALDVLDRVAAMGRPVRFTELLSDSVHPKATLYRLLQTLVSQGMLAYDESQQTYSLGIRLVRLAHAAWRQSSIAPIARPFVRALSEVVGETVHLAQLDGGQVLYVDKRNAINPIDMYSQAGKIGPGYCTGVGKAQLAFLEPAELDEAIKKQSFYRYTPETLATETALRADLEKIRKEGVAFDREEHEPGIICIAAPVLSSKGRPIGALSVTTSTTRKGMKELVEVRPVLLKTASEIAAAVEDWQFPA
ncbi:MAG: IclR family transcriptional regulator [Roseibium album]|uniref:Transcriptional regulator KdgR n=1 Tax=Roseibium album TaxID=311410 RepID=A0A0M7A5U3_9HYPH|nr:IclR family transcriptional regulator [Roseibium album]MBG6142223.1 DNA-binding IclR family transcriptional regulator [Labrenzia sp. EL_142]MBG6160180.1 DNA-binding IclR family transcriptional regulator [Labrenzia sp. EL_162]MBG6166218.1 DNA-binding IclR family transcriptional regulator [Labrenzia sp. EL_195]MBG6178075.1 DNA-binding IclR family transcriptional regulator [Labrenzia sp. EL_132]MBG6198712.1 DNA-binding IclR family transcriptional regulator [Labrenzia sp. EL_159]MBG6205096.1 D